MSELRSELRELKVIAVDLDSFLQIGAEKVYGDIKRLWPGRRPQLWCWISTQAPGFYRNQNLGNAAKIDYFQVSPDFSTASYQPLQVLLFSRSVHIAYPIRKAKTCQTIVGDSLQVLECMRGDAEKAAFKPQFKVEFSHTQKDFLLHTRKSIIFKYLTTDCNSIAELNMSLWLQERCEGVAVLSGQTCMVATTKAGIEEWEAIIRKELEWVPEKEKERDKKTPEKDGKDGHSKDSKESKGNKSSAEKDGKSSKRLSGASSRFPEIQGVSKESRSSSSGRDTKDPVGMTPGAKSMQMEKLLQARKKQAMHAQGKSDLHRKLEKISAAHEMSDIERELVMGEERQKKIDEDLRNAARLAQLRQKNHLMRGQSSQIIGDDSLPPKLKGSGVNGVTSAGVNRAGSKEIRPLRRSGQEVSTSPEPEGDEEREKDELAKAIAASIKEQDAKRKRDAEYKDVQLVD